MNYRIAYPDRMQDFLLRPNAAFRVRGARGNLWASGGYTVGPMPRTVIAIEPSLGLDGNPVIEATIHPRFPYHHVFTGEVGAEIGGGSLWASLSRELPIKESLPSTWYSFPYGPSTLGAVGGELPLPQHFRVTASALAVHEEAGELPIFLRGVPTVSRFSYQRATQLGLDWTGLEALPVHGRWIRDLEHGNDFVSADAAYTVAAVTFGMSLDLLLTPSDQGFMGQYLGDDRVRWTASYAF